MKLHNKTVKQMKAKIFQAVLLLGMQTACQNDDENVVIYSFSGKAQKGPFITGTTVNLNELNANLGQTGRSFSTTITLDDGSFDLNNIELNSDLVLLTANGFYFSELYGELSSAPLSLQAVADLTVKETININILTHLIKGSIEQLVTDGLTFPEANDQAKAEMLSFLGISDSFELDFADLDMFQSDDHNAVLLSFSIILQRYTLIWNERQMLVGELTQLLSGMSSDFKDDGQINNQSLVDTLLYNISQLNYLDIRKNLESRLTALNQPVNIPDFEKFIAKFQEKHDPNVYTNFFYPDSASPEPVMAPDSKLQNLLALNDTIFQAGKPYSIAAITPLNASLT
ncbi:hypothetical protein KA005_16630, partial [bacterium]|nr:hypothetical protein [bacterium]